MPNGMYGGVRGERNSPLLDSCRKEAMPMKYGVAVTIIRTGYVEVVADCVSVAKAKDKEKVAKAREVDRLLTSKHPIRVSWSCAMEKRIESARLT